MAVDAKTRGEIEKRARLYEVAKEKIVSRIQDNVRMAKEKLDLAERELLEEVEVELGENPFEKLLVEINSGNPLTDADVRSVLDKGVPQDFVPSEESFLSLCREIEAFKSWRVKKAEKPSVAAPSNVRVESTTWDSITLAWDTVEGASSYQVEVDWGKIWDASSNTFTKRGLLPDTEHTFRVRAVKGNSVSEWSDAVKGRTQKLSAPSSFRVESTTQDSITIVWNDDWRASSYQIEVDGGRSLERALGSTFTKRGLLPDTEHTFRVRAVRGDSVSEWSDAVKGRTQKLSAPSSFSAKSATQDSITIVWNDDWRASSYQIEVDGGRSLERVTKNTFTKRGLLPDTEHTFKVRAVRGDSVSGWSDVVKGMTQKWKCVWKECPGYVDVKRKYSVYVKNPRIATKVGDYGNYCCTIIGNTPLPLNKVTSWSIKVLKSRWNNGDGILIGVAPSDIDQNESGNPEKCGWYFGCYSSALWSGPPHKYRGKKYGPRKERNGQYVHTGDSVGVVMDTAKGELSFVLSGVNLGVAFEGIPLDKPLVPCVILYYQGDSVELVI